MEKAGSSNPQSNAAELPELVRQNPELWQDVMGSIRSAVERKQMSQLAEMGQRAGATINRWQSAAGSPLSQTDHARIELIKAQMTSLAIDQFITAFTRTGAKPSIRDQVVLKWGLTRHLQSAKTLTLAQYQKAWLRLTDHAAAASAIQQSGFWSVPTKELCLGLKECIKNRPVLEVGAGRGLFVTALNEVGVKIEGVDNCTWTMAKNVLPAAKPFMRLESAEEALRRSQPSVVLGVWPPPGNKFEKVIFETKSVNLYLAIVSAHQFASGNWQDYKAQESKKSQFYCVMNESLNKMLRPLESDQRLLIFRRKT